MKKLLSILSAIGITATASSTVVACGWSNAAAYPSGNSLPPFEKPSIADPSGVNPNDNESWSNFQKKLILSGDNLNDWRGNYEAYAEAYADNVSAYLENKNYNPDEKGLSDQERKDIENERKTNTYMEAAYFTMYSVMKSYALSQMFILWNQLDLNKPDFNKMSNEDLKSILMQFYNIQISINNWNSAYASLVKSLLSDNNEKKVWALVNKDMNGFYWSNATKLLNAANAVLLIKGNPEDKLYLQNIMAEKYLHFDETFANEVQVGLTTCIHVNDELENVFIDSKKIEVFDEDGKKLNDVPSKLSISFDSAKSNINIFVPNDVKANYHLTFRFSSNSIKENITFMVINKRT